MTILDRYILKKFIQVLLYAIAAFITIFIVVDLIENLDHFINYKFPKETVFTFYIYYIPFIVVLVLPIAMLISSLFSIGNLAKQNEIVAMKAAGISLYRIFLPIFCISVIISILAFGIANYLVPGATEKQAIINEKYSGKTSRTFGYRLSNIQLRDDQGHQIIMRNFNVQNNVGNTVSIRTFDNSNLLFRIDARRMTWQDSMWLLHEGYVRDFSNNRETAIPFDKREFRDTSLRPENIAKILKNPEEMSYAELQEFIAEVKRNGGDPDRWLVDLYLKIALPLANFIIVLFGSPLSSSQTQRTGVTKGFGISLIVTFIYFGILKTTQAMGHNGKIEPLLAAWFSNLIFGVIGLFILIRAKK